MTNKREYNVEYKQWRKSVLDRFNSCCNYCGSFKRIQAHHIKSWKDYPKLRFDIKNGEAVCYKCHIKIHPFMVKYEKLAVARKKLKVKKLRHRQKVNKKRRPKNKEIWKNKKAKKNPKVKPIERCRKERDQKEKYRKAMIFEFFGAEKEDIKTNEAHKLRDFIVKKEMDARFEKRQQKKNKGLVSKIEAFEEAYREMFK